MIGIIRRLGLALAVAAAMVPAIPVGLSLCTLPGGRLPVRVLVGDCTTTRCHEDPCCGERPDPAPSSEADHPPDTCGCCIGLTVGGSDAPPALRPNPSLPEMAPAPLHVVRHLSPSFLSLRVAALLPDTNPPPPDLLQVPLRI